MYPLGIPCHQISPKYGDLLPAQYLAKIASSLPLLPLDTSHILSRLNRIFNLFKYVKSMLFISLKL